MTKDEQSFPLKKPDNEHNPQNLLRSLLNEVTKQLEQMEKANVFKREDLLNIIKNTKNE